MKPNTGSTVDLRWTWNFLPIYFLPPYSPELSRIEILWRKIKYEWLPFK
ncbi:MAG: transposase [Methylovulum sp.]|nr:transposase [Methylovulum sp.]